MPAEDRLGAAGPIADPRLRIVAVGLLAFTYSALHGPLALGLMAGLTVALVVLGGARPGAVLRRLRMPGLVVAGLVAALPFSSGATVLATLGPLTLRAEGLAAAGGIALRFLCIAALVVVYLGALPVPRLVAGLRGLGLPALMVDMALLTLRHIEDLRADLARRATAMRLRGGGGLRARGWMLASLLVHSHARSERVWQAMLLRGHGAPGAAPPEAPPATPVDRAWLTAIAVLAACLIAVEYLA